MRTPISAPVLLCVALSLAHLSLAPSLSAQDAPPAYQPLIDGAVAEFAAGRWAEARALFQRAHDAYPNARTLRGIGMASYEMRDYPAAVRALAASIDDARRPLTEEQRAQVTELLTRARAFVGRFVVPPAPEGSRLYLDGTGAELEGEWPRAEGALLVGVGTHEVTIRSADGRAAHARLVVRGHEDGPLDIDLSSLVPAPEPVEIAARDTPSRPTLRFVPRDPIAEAVAPAADPLPWIIAGIGGAVMITGAIVLGVGLADRAAVQDAPHGTEWADLQGPYGRSGPMVAAGSVLLGVGVGAALVGVVWGALQPSPARREAALRIDVGIGSLAIGGTF